MERIFFDRRVIYADFKEVNVNFEIVVARYKEDISWTDLLNPEYRVTVYNKHEGQNLIENVGREAHTYLYHIISRYDSLADYTVFVQGNPLEHCDVLHQRLDQFLSLKHRDDFTFLFDSSQNIIQCDPNSQPFGSMDGKMIPSGKLYEALTLRKSPGFFIASPGSQFIASKKLIKSWKKEFYQKCINSVSYSSNPIEAHCFERIFPMIFEQKIQYSNVKIQYPDDSFYKEYVNSHIIEDEILLDGSLGFCEEK